MVEVLLRRIKATVVPDLERITSGTQLPAVRILNPACSNAALSILFALSLLRIAILDIEEPWML